MDLSLTALQPQQIRFVLFSHLSILAVLMEALYKTKRDVDVTWADQGEKR